MITRARARGPRLKQYCAAVSFPIPRGGTRISRGWQAISHDPHHEAFLLDSLVRKMKVNRQGS